MGKTGPQCSHSKNPAAKGGKRRGEERCLLAQVGCMCGSVNWVLIGQEKSQFK